MSMDRFQSLVDRMAYPSWTIQVGSDIAPHQTIILPWLRVGNPQGRCNLTGSPKPWWGRKWRLSEHMTDAEVVWTALKAIITAHEHEAREMFHFDHVPVGNSHVDIHKLVELHRDPAAQSVRSPARER